MNDYDATSFGDDFYLSGNINANSTTTGKDGFLVLYPHGPHGYSVPAIVMATAILQGIVGAIGVLSNALVIFVLTFARDRQDTSSVIYVLNLAVADLFFLLTVPFKISQDIQLRWTMGEILCKITWGFVTYLNFLVSALFLMVMSIDRYLAINKAVSSAKLRAISSSRIVCCIVWLIGTVAVIPLAVFHSAERGTRCAPSRFPGAKHFTDESSIICNHERKLIVDPDHYNRSEPIDPNFNYEYYFVAGEALIESSLDEIHGLNNSESTLLERITRNVANEKNSSLPKKRKRHKKSKRYKNRQKSAGIRIRELSISASPTPIPTTPTLPHTDELTSIIRTTGGTVTIAVRNSSEDGSMHIYNCRNAEESWTSIPGSHISGAINTTQMFYNTENEASNFLLNDLEMPDSFSCYHQGVYSFKVWVVFNFFYSFLLPCAVIVTCYTAILRKLYQPSGALRHTSSKRKVRHQTVRKKVTLMVAMLVVSYIICFTPYYIWQLAKIPGVKVPVLKTCYHVERLISTLTLINSAINPLLYTFLCDKFSANLQRATRKFVRTFGYKMTSQATQKSSKPAGNSNRDNLVAMVPRDALRDSSYRNSASLASPGDEKINIDPNIDMTPNQSSRKVSPVDDTKHQTTSEGGSNRKKTSSKSSEGSRFSSFRKQLSLKDKKRKGPQLLVVATDDVATKSNVTEVTRIPPIAHCQNKIDDVSAEDDELI